MRFRAKLIIGGALLLSACQSTPEPSLSPTTQTQRAVEIAITATASKTPTPTQTQTATPDWPTRVPTETPRPTVDWEPSVHHEVGGADSTVIARFGLGQLRDIALSPAGDRLAIAGSTGVSMLDPETFQELWHGTTKSTATEVEFSPDGTLLITSEPTGRIAIWTAVTGAVERTFELTNYQDATIQVAISPDNRLLAAKGYLPIARVWDVETGMQIYELPSLTEYSLDILFSPDGELLISNQGGYERPSGLQIWRVSDGHEVLRHEGVISNIAFTPDANTLLLGFGAAAIDLAQLSDEYELTNYGDSWWQWAGWAPDFESYVCFGVTCTANPDLVDGSDISAAIYDRDTGEVIRVLDPAPRAFYSFSPTGNYIAGASGQYYNQSQLFVWDAQTGHLLHNLPTDLGGDMTWLPNSDTMVALSFYDQALAAWDIPAGRILRMLRGSDQITKVEWTEDSTMLTGWWYQFNSAQPSRYVALQWDSKTGQVVESYDTPYPNEGAVPGTSLTATWDMQTVVVSDSSTGETYSLVQHSGEIQHVSWSSDGKRLASAGDDQTVILWNLDTKTPQTVLAILEGHIRDLEWSPDNQWIAVAAADDVIIWNTTTGERVVQLSHNADRVNAISWSQDSTLLVSASDDGAIYVWNAETGLVERVLQQHTGSVLDIAWSPDGRWIASGSSDGSVVIWDAEQ
jgi:WD40 repeat protein